MVVLVIDIGISCQRLDLFLYLVRWNIFISCKVVLWVIHDLRPLYMFGLIPTFLFLLEVDIRISIMFIIKMGYQGTLVPF